MKDTVERAKKLIEERGLSLIVIRDDQAIFESTESGLKPLVKVYTILKDLSGCVVVDRLVGRAAAFFFVEMRPSFVHAFVISEGAIGLLNKHGVKFSYEEEVPFVLSRNGKNMCPFEKMLLDVNDPKEAIERILSKFTLS
ncbi:DUF1893 domain-containing protein [Thermotoga sp. SG1]|uniref:DUF1893 domain-containing protein n=1 Tax=Thermotoga sp. SG1 TaxID=126739 RepID=UPI001E3C6960|nr:DUF1893 domain-containing protein [Thermotoga sp. SG1]